MNRDLRKNYCTRLAMFLAVVIVSAVTGGIFMLLWNWLVPILWSSAPILTFWQAWGLYILINLTIRSHVKVKRNGMD